MLLSQWILKDLMKEPLKELLELKAEDNVAQSVPLDSCAVSGGLYSHD